MAGAPAPGPASTVRVPASIMADLASATALVALVTASLAAAVRLKALAACTRTSARTTRPTSVSMILAICAPMSCKPFGISMPATDVPDRLAAFDGFLAEVAFFAEALFEADFALAGARAAVLPLAASPVSACVFAVLFFPMRLPLLEARPFQKTTR